MDSERYKGRAFLRLLELYVLAAIDELDDIHRQTLEKMTPELRGTYGCQGTWDEIIRSVMDFPPEMPRLIRERWAHNQRLAQAHGEDLVPEDFARMFCDANFADEFSA